MRGNGPLGHTGGLVGGVGPGCELVAVRKNCVVREPGVVEGDGGSVCGHCGESLVWERV